MHVANYTYVPYVVHLEPKRPSCTRIEFKAIGAYIGSEVFCGFPRFMNNAEQLHVESMWPEMI